MTVRLAGRRAELARIDALLADAHRRRGGALILAGATGSGRSTLLAAAAGRAGTGGFTVRRAAGRASEAAIDGAVLSELLDDHETGPATVLARLVALAESAPLVLAVDDLHLADPPSAHALLYASRRIARYPIAFLASVAVDARLDPARADVESIELDGLDEEGVHELCALVACPVAPEVARRLRELTGGNPLAVIELARTSTPEQRSGAVAIPELPAISAAAVRSFAEAFASLPDATRRALCVAAAEPTGRIDRIAPALSALGEHPSVLDPAEEAELVHVVDGCVRFDHPLRRVVAYALLAPPSRRAAHRALAQAWADPDDAEHRLAHMAAGAPGPDDALAEDAVALAAHLERRGRTAAAEAAWRTASRFATDPATTADLLARAEAAGRAASAGQPPGSAPLTGPLATLTVAERRVALVVGAGCSNRQAAERLYLSAKTVDAHLQAIFRKLDIRSRAQLAVLVTRSTGGGS